MLETFGFETAQGPADHHGVDRDAAPLADVDLEAMLEAQAPGEPTLADHHGVEIQVADKVGEPVAFLPVSVEAFSL